MNNYIKHILYSIIYGAMIGFTIICMVELTITLEYGIDNIVFTGREIFNGVIGSFVVGQFFALPTIIYTRENMPLPLAVLVQMSIGFIGLFTIGAYLKWYPTNLGIGPIISFIVISLILGFVIWTIFYLYDKKESEKINKKLKEINS